MTKFSLILFLLSVFHSFAQVNVGSRDFWTCMQSVGKLNEDDINELKYKPTILVIPDNQKDKLELYKEATAGWTFNFIRVITESELPTFAGRLTTNAFIHVGWSRSDRSSFFHLDYIMPYNPDGKVKEKIFAMVELNPDDSTSSMAWRIKPSDSEKYFGQFINESGHFHNLTPAHMKIYLSFISAQVSAMSTHWLYAKNLITTNKELVKQLANDTLFVPDYVMPFNKKVSQSDVLKERKALFADYKYKTLFVTAEEFEKRILNATKPTFVLICQTVGNVSKLNIYEAKSGASVYTGAHEPSGFKYGLSEKQVKMIAKKIDKAVED